MKVTDCESYRYAVNNATVYKYDTDKIATSTNRESVNLRDYNKTADNNNPAHPIGKSNK
jgi:hypothetical protein